MFLVVTLGMCASVRFIFQHSQVVLIQMRQQRLGLRCFATWDSAAKITLDGCTKSLARFGAITRERNCNTPEPRTQRNMTGKAGRAKSSVVTYKTIQVGHFKSGHVGDGFQSCELDSSCLRALGNGCGFHVYGNRAIGFRESSLLFCSSYARGAQENSFASCDFSTDSIGGIDHDAGFNHISHLQATTKTER